MENMLGSLVEKLVAQLPPGTIEKETRATEVRREDHWIIETDKETYTADGLIIALPAPRAPRRLASRSERISTAR